jgi:hypothetical protein
MRQRDLIDTMGAEEVFEWMAYELTQDPEYRENLDRKMQLERQMRLSDEERSAMIKSMFLGIQNKK